MKLKRLVNNLIILKNASQVNKLSTILYRNAITLEILTLFYKNGYISGYQFLGLYKVRVYLKYFKNKGVLLGIHFPKKYTNSCSYLALKRNYRSANFNFLTVLSTTRGVLTSLEIIQKKLNVGGLILFYIKFF